MYVLGCRLRAFKVPRLLKRLVGHVKNELDMGNSLSHATVLVDNFRGFIGVVLYEVIREVLGRLQSKECHDNICLLNIARQNAA